MRPNLHALVDTARWLRRARLARIVRWRSHGSNTSAPSAATPRSPGRGSARAAGRGTRSRSGRRRPEGGRPRARRAPSAGRRDADAPARRRGRALGPRPDAGSPSSTACWAGAWSPGSLVLLGGAPGIGKSTLASMALANVHAAGAPTLYVSGEESAAQIRTRAERLGDAALDVPVIAENSLEAVLATVEAERPAVCVIDSVQTLAVGEATPGSVAAVREATGGPDGRRQAPRRDDAPDRARDQGGLARRPAGARAPGRLRAPLRGRARADVPDSPGAEEPLRRDQRDRGVRDEGGRPRRGRRRVGPLRRRGEPGAGLGDPLLDGGDPPAAGRGPGARRTRPRWCPRGAPRPGWTATGWRWCSRS